FPRQFSGLFPFRCTRNSLPTRVRLSSASPDRWSGESPNREVGSRRYIDATTASQGSPLKLSAQGARLGTARYRDPAPLAPLSCRAQRLLRKARQPRRRKPATTATAGTVTSLQR